MFLVCVLCVCSGCIFCVFSVRFSVSVFAFSARVVRICVCVCSLISINFARIFYMFFKVFCAFSYAFFVFRVCFRVRVCVCVCVCVCACVFACALSCATYWGAHFCEQCTTSHVLDFQPLFATITTTTPRVSSKMHLFEVF